MGFSEGIESIGPRYGTALLVEPPGSTRNDHQAVLREAGINDVILRDHVSDTMHSIHRIVDVAFVHVELPRPGSVALALLGMFPFPHLVALGVTATPLAAFELARSGFSDYLQLPLLPEHVTQCLERLERIPKALETILRSFVGRMPLREAQRELRTAMLSTALSTTNGSRRSAARLLGVTRPAVQRMIKEAEESRTPQSFPPTPRSSELPPADAPQIPSSSPNPCSVPSSRPA